MDETREIITEVFKDAIEVGILKNVVVRKADILARANEIVISRVLDMAGQEMTASDAKTVMELIGILQAVQEQDDSVEITPSIHYQMFEE